MKPRGRGGAGDRPAGGALAPGGRSRGGAAAVPNLLSPSPAPAEATTPHRGVRASVRRQRRRCVVRVRADQAPAEEGAARDRHARLLRVRRLRLDVRADPAHGAEGERRHLPALADRRRHPLSRAVRHRAVHEVVDCAAIRGALAHLRARPKRRVQPDLGGRATSASRSAASSPRTSQTAGGSCTCRSRGRSGSRIRTTAGSTGSTSRRWTTRCAASRRSVKLHMPLERAEGVISEPDKAVSAAAATRSSRSCATSRSATRTSCSHVADAHGTPPLSAPHGVCAAREGRGRRLRLELLLEGLGRTAGLRVRRERLPLRARQHAQHRSNGRWSDGVPIAPLKIQDAAPIRP